MTLIYLAAAFLAGVYTGSLTAWPVEGVAAAGILAAAVAALWRRDASVRLFAVCVLALAAGMLRFASVPHAPAPDDLARFAGGAEVQVTGVVSEPPDVRDSRTNLRVAVTGASRQGNLEPAVGQVQVTVARYPEYRYGDVLELTGRVQLAPVFDDFSYRDYLARQGVHSVMYRPRTVLLQRDTGNPMLALLYGVRDRAESMLTAAVAEPQAGLAAGVLLGTRHALPEDVTADLQTAGLTHIVVVSGYNLSLVAALLTGLTRRRFGPRVSLVLSVAGVVLFTLLVGAGAAVVRAAIMVTLGLIALTLGRQNWGPTAVALSAGLMVAWQPTVLWDVGFQLSVAATVGLVWLAPVFEGRLGRLPTALRSNLAVALAAQAMTMPIIADNFGRVSAVAPLANLAVLWAVPGLMLASFATAAAGILWPPAAAAIGWVAWLFGMAILAPAQALATLPVASVDLPHVHPAMWAVYFAALAAIAGRLSTTVATGVEPARRGPSLVRRNLDVAILTLAVVLVWAAVAALPDGRLHVWFLNVGEGDATLIRSPRGQTVLVDGGPSPLAITSAMGRILPFWQRGLDLVVVTHANEDHLLGMVEVARRYRIAQVIEPGGEPASAGHRELDRLLNEAGAARNVAERGQQVDLGDGATLTVIGPLRSAIGAAGDNRGSVVLRLDYGGLSVLLPGDIDAGTGRELAAAGAPVNAAVLKVPHHGARSALDAGLLDRVSPQAAVISVGAGNTFGHPAAETLQLLAGLPVYRTDVNGTVEIIADATGWRIQADR